MNIVKYSIVFYIYVILYLCYAVLVFRLHCVLSDCRLSVPVVYVHCSTFYNLWGNVVHYFPTAVKIPRCFGKDCGQLFQVK